ncbi:MAG: (Fe-S)-binding protein [Proteobacteria bacterium]|nr:(Fe-S)-binding protein [Pseudomonadota bacterium]
MSNLAELKRDMEGCSRCSHCKWVPMAQIKSWRYAKVCPSVDKFNFHMYSGGGKMIAANSILEERSEITDTFADIVYACQLCGACQVSCQAYRDDIDLSDVLLQLRAKCVQEAYVLPEHLEVIDSMKREDNTLGMQKRDRGNWAEGLDIPNINKQKVDVLFHVGCQFSYDEELRETVRSWAKFLKDQGVDIGIAGKDEACCGGRAFEIGYQGEMKNFAEDMTSRVKASGAKLIVTPCSDCYYTFKYLYPKNGIDLGVKVLHTTEYVDSLIKNGSLQLRNKVPMKVTYHDPCHLGRRGEIYKAGWEGDNKLFRPVRFKQNGCLGIYDPPRDIIKSIPGVELIEMERIREYSWCCGAGGGVYEAFPEFAKWTAAERIEEAKSTGAEAIVTACPWCERVFNDTIEENGEDIKILDMMDLLTLSLGGK